MELWLFSLFRKGPICGQRDDAWGDRAPHVVLDACEGAGEHRGGAPWGAVSPRATGPQMGRHGLLGHVLASCRPASPPACAPAVNARSLPLPATTCRPPRGRAVDGGLHEGADEREGQE